MDLFVKIGAKFPRSGNDWALPSGQIVIGPPSARSKRRCRPEIGGDVVPCTAVSAGQCVGPTAVSQSGRRRADVGSRRQNDSRLGIGTSSSERRRHRFIGPIIGVTSAARRQHRSARYYKLNMILAC